MKTFSTLLSQRRSTRKFKDTPLEPEHVEFILKAALKSPTSKNLRPWQFVVVEDSEMLQKLSESKEHGAGFLKSCAMAVVVVGDVTLTDVWIEDASIASICMQLQAEDLGIGSCWCQIRNRQTANDEDAAYYVRNLLGIPYQLEVLSIIGFGHKDQDRKPLDDNDLLWEKIHIGQYRNEDLQA